ncbi:hypothetical protein AB4212_41590, partial [Streptomyces sp. 2MCAF27]
MGTLRRDITLRSQFAIPLGTLFQTSTLHTRCALVAMSSQAADRPVPVRGADINEKDIAAACRGVNDVLTETMQGEESQGRVIGPMPLRGQKGPDMFQALKVLQSAGLDGGLGLADQG